MNVCTRCGATNQPTSKFCLSCGNPLAAGAAPPGHGPPPPAPAPAPHAPIAPAQAAASWGQAPAPPPPPYGAPPVQPWQPPTPAGYAPPQPAWNPPPARDLGDFVAPAPERARFGAPDGMNPFGATVGTEAHPAYGPPPAAPQAYAPPPAQAYPPPPAQAYAPAPAPAPAYAPPPQRQWAAPTPASVQQSHDPSAFAATAPPPTSDEYENQRWRSQAPAQAPAGPNPSAPPLAAAAPPATALAPGRDPELLDASAMRALAGFLVSYDHNELGVFWPLYQGQNVLGRKGAAPGLDIEIDSPTTSSRHAVLFASARPGRIKVEDGGSTNGTFLNDAQLERGKKFELRDNDVLRLGGFNVIVKIL